jgi:hypothetical protein
MAVTFAYNNDVCSKEMPMIICKLFKTFFYYSIARHVNIGAAISFCQNGTFDLNLIDKLRKGSLVVPDIFGCFNLTGTQSNHYLIF